MERREAAVVQLEVRHCSRPKVLDHDIRALDELAEELLAFGCLEVKSERALVPIEANERR